MRSGKVQDIKVFEIHTQERLLYMGTLLRKINEIHIKGESSTGCLLFNIKSVIAPN
jgi:hypothetical protein